MKTELLNRVESKSLKKNIPQFDIGDVVDVACKIKEGDKERTQVFSGTVIARRGRGINTMVTVRRIVNDEGVERIFPLHSPNVESISVIRSGKTRRATLRKPRICRVFPRLAAWCLFRIWAIQDSNL